MTPEEFDAFKLFSRELMEKDGYLNEDEEIKAFESVMAKMRKRLVEE